MKLISIRKDAQEIAAFISEIVGVNVIIVDDEMIRITDTFRYPYNQIDIRARSIIGNIIASGLPQVVEDKDYFDSCVKCTDRDYCKMQGLIGVPIRYQDVTIGAIGLVLEKCNIKRLLENINLVLTFLEQIAGLLSSKLSSQVDRANLQRMSSQWTGMLDMMESGVALVDERGSIVVCNERFNYYFRVGKDCFCHGRFLSELVDHSLVVKSLREKVDVDAQSIVVPLPQTVFCGDFHIKHMWQGNVYCGAVFIFRSSCDLPSNNLLLYNGYGSETINRICGGSAVGRKLQSILSDPDQKNQPIFLCGVSEEHLLRLAVAFHNSAKRPGRFVLVNGRGLYETDRKKTFPIFEDAFSPFLEARQGTLCITEVFSLPVYIQHWLLGYLSPDKKSPSQGMLQTHFIFLSDQLIQSTDLLFRDPDLVDILQHYRVDVPNHMRTPQQLQALLRRSLDHFSSCYGKSDISVAPEAWELLQTFPLENDEQSLHKVVEYLVRNCGGVITREAVAKLREQLMSPVRDVKAYERQEIERLLNTGISYDRIADILHISRATLYRRIKKYQLKTERK